jgi:hypothetical protein
MRYRFNDLRGARSRAVAFCRSTPHPAVVVIRNDQSMRISAKPTDVNSNHLRLNTLHQIPSLLIFATLTDAHHHTQTQQSSASSADFPSDLRA